MHTPVCLLVLTSQEDLGSSPPGHSNAGLSPEGWRERSSVCSSSAVNLELPESLHQGVALGVNLVGWNRWRFVWVYLAGI